LLDGGVSTHAPLRTLSSELHQELRVHVAVSNFLGLGRQVQAAIAEQASGGPADGVETSCLQVIRPDLVRMERAVKQIDLALPGTRGNDRVRKFSLGGKMITSSGINGDAILATAAKGELMLAAMAQDIVDFLEALAAL
jgi:creatinine amidohydrolase